MTNNKNNIFTPYLYDVYFPNNVDLKDPNSIYGIYFVFEYIDKTMAKFLKTPNFVFQKEHIIVLTYNLLCAVKFIHDSNIIHRDLKPSNILITD